MNLYKLECVICGAKYNADEVEYNCPACGDEGILDVIFDYEKISSLYGTSFNDLVDTSVPTLWRYKKLLPVELNSAVPESGVGFTPLYKAERLRKLLGVNNLFIKDDGRNPTASLKDRASAVGIVKAMEKGVKTATCASTGNAACSFAYACAITGIKSHIFLPQTAPKAKIAQLLIYGANVIAIKDTYDRAYELAIEATKKWGWYNRNCAYNPYLVEGKKTVALEIIEQMGIDNPPDSIVVSIGDGCICSSIGKAVTDMYELGFISKMPRIIGVQASGCSPIYDALKNGTEVIECVPDTIADSIAVGLPRNRFKAMKYLKKTDGIVEKVTDEEILNATRVLARNSGVFGEPAGTTAFAGYLKLLEKGTISKNENVAVIITGNGLKDIDSAMKAVGKPHIIDPSIENVEKILNEG